MGNRLITNKRQQTNCHKLTKVVNETLLNNVLSLVLLQLCTSTVALCQKCQLSCQTEGSRNAVLLTLYVGYVRSKTGQLFPFFLQFYHLQ